MTISKRTVKDLEKAGFTIIHRDPERAVGSIGKAIIDVSI